MTDSVACARLSQVVADPNGLRSGITVFAVERPEQMQVCFLFIPKGFAGRIQEGETEWTPHLSECLAYRVQDARPILSSLAPHKQGVLSLLAGFGGKKMFLVSICQLQLQSSLCLIPMWHILKFNLLCNESQRFNLPEISN